MSDSELYTVGVFGDAAGARRALAALVADGFEADALSVLGGDAPSLAVLAEALGRPVPDPSEVRGLGRVRMAGPAIGVLQGDDGGLLARGLAATAGRLGFQMHDGRIFEALVARGGVLVAVESAARAADALAVLHAYGGGNAAIGAWAGRL